MSATATPDDQRVVAGFVRALRSDGVTPTTLVWFGSRATGEAHDAESDYDLIVVAPEFTKVPWVDRLRAAYGCWPLEQAADILCYTPEEFEHLAQHASIVREALQTGRQVVCTADR